MAHFDRAAAPRLSRTQRGREATPCCLLSSPSSRIKFGAYPYYREESHARSC